MNTPEQEAALLAARAAFPDEASMHAGFQEIHLKRSLTTLLASFAGSVTISGVDWARLDACLTQPLTPDINPERVRAMVRKEIARARTQRDMTALMRGLLLLYFAERDKTI